MNTRQKVCETNAVAENSSFIFKVCVRSVPLHQFKLAYVVLHMAVKEAYHFLKRKNRPF